MPHVSVLMPTFDRAPFIPRAVDSLRAQTLADWELVIVDDGSRDGTPDAVRPLLADERIRYHRLPTNRGLGAALNVGLGLARASRVAYLPDDDLFHREHLAALAALLDREPDAALAIAGVRHHYNRDAAARIDGHPLQLVQVMHRPTVLRWVERRELVTDDLDRLFWSRLLDEGRAVETRRISCEWVEHPGQHHRLIREPTGGINPYRQRYRVDHPLRFRSTVGNAIDEVALYRRFRERPDTPLAADGLTILLVGDLSYSGERVLALEERGHALHGLWTPQPHWYTTVGPVPFGHVRDVPHDDWRGAVGRLRPDVIYAQQNWQSVPFALEVRRAFPDIPFVWHFKEGPFICLRNGTWPQLAELYATATALIHPCEEIRAWVARAVPAAARRPTLVLDGDLPKADWMAGQRTPRLSEHDGEIHTVVPGRPIGLHPWRVEQLARAGVHLHFYGDYTQGQWDEWIARVRALASGHLHLHPHVDQRSWVAELSRYDAGWLHLFTSHNDGDLHRADWDDLNLPARIAPLALAGVPVLQLDNAGSVVAMQSLARALGIGVFARTMGEMAERLRDARAMAHRRERTLAVREWFTFDHHADRLVAFFRDAIAAH